MTEVKTSNKSEKPKETPKTSSSESKNNTANSSNQQKPNPNKNAAVPKTEKLYPHKQTLAIGDSIMIDIEPYLKEAVPNITIDGKIGRQLSDAIDLATGYRAFNTKDSGIIIELGTNGPFTEKQLNRLLDQFDQAHIYLVNSRVPRGWESEVNAAIETARSRSNVTVIDWYSLASSNSSFFEPDGVHLKKNWRKSLCRFVNTKH
ncbi:putative peptidoglycan O-acetyltransferase YrhL [Listeria floridensis FSL S10-1187]|uniref:Peptidoglycan O-acetyltransferase YrhL n=1 Tax=Listeria floridensis FSL S10-1187 TaxID=1265817 RepID=A0ABP3B0D1_9LIST|nr:putative peptidoglycan O-acetyltransferase YrhL [Listeria floridensis FSL S10-1187]